MDLIKNFIVKPILKSGFKKNTLSNPKLVELEEKPCIGYSITTSLRGNRKKEDIPPFFHNIYDNDKLSTLWEKEARNMYCIFNLHENGQDFDYHIATENKLDLHTTEYAEITLPGGKYVMVEFLKRNHTAVSKVMMYLRAIWLEGNGHKAKNSPAFIVYDERFHLNYKQHGCVNGNYPGQPVASYYIPVEA